MDTYRYLWAKTDREHPESESVHPLWAHLIDVGMVAMQLWEGDLVPAFLKDRICQDLGLAPEEAGHFLGLWIGLHDIGKAIPCFQVQHTPSRIRLSQMCRLHFKEGYQRKDDRMAHGHASVLILNRYLTKQNLTDVQKETLKNLTLWIGFHHGNIERVEALKGKNYHNTDKLDSPLGDAAWEAIQDQLLTTVIDVWQQKYPFSFPKPTLSNYRTHPDWLLAFAGFVTTADWLGSMGEYFSDAQDTFPKDDLVAYLDKSFRNAKKALVAAGFGMTSKMDAKHFDQLFPSLAPFKPRPLQTHGLTLPLSEGPTLTIVEAPTGEGKTECALILANRQQAINNQGVYIAMPTQAMSNGLFGRFKDFLEQSHGVSDEVNLRLVHGNDFLSDAQAELLFSPAWQDIAAEDISEDEVRSEKADLKTARWFMPKKRALLAKYGLGTIDQVLLSVLFAKHFFLRLYGLAGKTIIFDEVHAYDTYMTTLLCRLLQWLKALNCNVVMLSATLPSRTRKAFQEAWVVKKGIKEVQGEPTKIPYPCMWTSNQTEPIPVQHDTSREQQANIAWLSDDIVRLSEEVVEAYQAGATVAVILNVVDRAQSLFEEVSKFVAKEDLHLFHARFPFKKRQEREEKVLGRFGKNRSSKPAIMIATQVAEASLDLDFDVMFSDLAPVDLLLQRAGRLHRHHRVRPEGYESPVFYVLCGETDALPNVQEVSGHEKIYDHIVLYRTYFALKQKEAWHLPFDYRPLIEHVYPASGDLNEAINLAEKDLQIWYKCVERVEKAADTEVREAKKRLIPKPSESDKMVYDMNKVSVLEDEENNAVRDHLRALTRLGDSISVICFHLDGVGNILLKYPTEEVLDLGQFEDVEVYQKQAFAKRRETLKNLFWNGLSLSAKDVIKAMREARAAQPSWWQNLTQCLPMLKYHYPMVFENEAWQMGESRVVKWDEMQGLKMLKKEH